MAEECSRMPWPARIDARGKAVLGIGIGMIFSAYVGDGVDLAMRSLRRTALEPLCAATGRFGLSAQVEAPSQMTRQRQT